MSLTTVLLLIGALIGLLILVNAIEQYKQRLAHERHQLLLKLAAIIAEDDELLINAVQVPLSIGLQKIILRRSISVIEQVLKMVPDSHSMPNRLRDAKEHLQQLEAAKETDLPALTVPTNDAHSAAMIKTIKKIRYILSKQQAKGSISKRDFAREDQILAHNLLRIFVEYKILQAEQAINDDKLGSARQFYEKALKTLRSQGGESEYVLAKEREIIEKTNEISSTLKNREASSEFERIEMEDEDYEIVFSETKKKFDME